MLRSLLATSGSVNLLSLQCLYLVIRIAESIVILLNALLSPLSPVPFLIQHCSELPLPKVILEDGTVT